GWELGDGVAQHRQGDLRLDRHRGLVDPLTGKRRYGPGPDEHLAPAVGEQTHLATGIALVGVRPGDRLGEADAGRFQLDALLARLSLRDSHGRELGIGEHDAGDRLVAGMRLLSRDVGGDYPPLILPYVGEWHHPCHIADRPHALRGPAALVHLDATRAGLDPHRLKAQALDPRAAPGGDEQLARAHLLAVGQCHSASIALAAHRFGASPEAQIDSVLPQGLRDQLRDRRLLAWDQPLLCVDEGDVTAEAREELAELDAHGPASQHDHAVGQLGHRGGLAGGPVAGLRQPLERRDRGVTAGRDDDPVGRERGLADLHRGGPADPALALVYVDSFLAIPRHLLGVVEGADPVVPVGGQLLDGRPPGGTRADHDRVVAVRNHARVLPYLAAVKTSAPKMLGTVAA